MVSFVAPRRISIISGGVALGGQNSAELVILDDDVGFEFATKKLVKADPYYLTETERVGRLVLSGNDAIVAGALMAGCRFYAGYPITPASEILEGMAKALPRLGGVNLQAEDEFRSPREGVEHERRPEA